MVCGRLFVDTDEQNQVDLGLEMAGDSGSEKVNWANLWLIFQLGGNSDAHSDPDLGQGRILLCILIDAALAQEQ